MIIPNGLVKVAHLFKQKRYAYVLAAASMVLVAGTGFVLAHSKPSEQKPAAATQTSTPPAEVAADAIVTDTTVPQTSSTSTTTPNTPQAKPTAAQPKAIAATAQTSQTTPSTSTSTTPPATGGTATPKPVLFGIAGTNNFSLAVGGSQQGTIHTTDSSVIAWQPGGETTMWVGYGPEKPFAPAFLYLHGTPGHTSNSITFHVETTATATPGTVLQFYVHVSDPARGIDRIHTIYVTIQ